MFSEGKWMTFPIDKPGQIFCRPSESDELLLDVSAFTWMNGYRLEVDACTDERLDFR